MTSASTHRSRRRPPVPSVIATRGRRLRAGRDPAARHTTAPRQAEVQAQVDRTAPSEASAWLRTRPVPDAPTRGPARRPPPRCARRRGEPAGTFVEEPPGVQRAWAWARASTAGRQDRERGGQPRRADRRTDRRRSGGRAGRGDARAVQYARTGRPLLVVEHRDERLMGGCRAALVHRKRRDELRGSGLRAAGTYAGMTAPAVAERSSDERPAPAGIDALPALTSRHRRRSGVDDASRSSSPLTSGWLRTGVPGL